jgi:hypothetical protein
MQPEEQLLAVKALGPAALCEGALYVERTRGVVELRRAADLRPQDVHIVAARGAGALAQASRGLLEGVVREMRGAIYVEARHALSPYNPPSVRATG